MVFMEMTTESPTPADEAGVQTESARIDDRLLAELLDRMAGAAAAYIRGDIRHYLALFDHPDDYSLMPPYGGETRVGFHPTEQDLEETSRFFATGEATLDVEHTYVSGNLVVLVAVERQHGEVGGYPDQDWSLRVTIVFRRVGDRWQIVHRHADPLVREIPFSHLAVLARGDVSDGSPGPE
jgi:ketosteroid isomerase-like protein